MLRTGVEEGTLKTFVQETEVMDQLIRTRKTKTGAPVDDEAAAGFSKAATKSVWGKK